MAVREGIDDREAYARYVDEAVILQSHARCRLVDELLTILVAHDSASALLEKRDLSHGTMREPLQRRIAPMMPFITAATLAWTNQVAAESQPLFLDALRERGID